MNNKTLISIVGGSYFQPISDMLAVLSELEQPKQSEVQVSDRENGYAAAVCILLAVSFESYVTRVHAVSKNNPREKRESVINYLRRRFPEYHWDEVEEVFVVRDALAHNHLWELGYFYDEDGIPQLSSSDKDEHSGDRKYDRLVDLSSRKTNILALNVNPILVNRNDVEIAVNVVWNALVFLEEADRFQCPVSHQSVVYGGKRIYFSEVVADWNS